MSEEFPKKHSEELFRHDPPEDLLGDINSRIDRLVIKAANAAASVEWQNEQYVVLKQSYEKLVAQQNTVREEAFRDGWTARALYSENNTLETVVNHYLNLKK